MADNKKKILVFASGDAEGGGSGFQEMVEFSRTTPPVLDAEIVGVVSNHATGGVFKKASKLGITFEHWAGPFTAEGYRYYMENFHADYVMCSGWLKFVRGLPIERTINIHPGPLPDFGGPGFFGHHVHEAVHKAFENGEIKQSAVTMHFVDDRVGYDRGPIICQLPVLIRPEDTPDTIGSRVNEKERLIQSIILNFVVNGKIYLDDGKVYYRDINLRDLSFL